MALINWAEWYEETLDALVLTLEESSVQWGTDPEGEPWIVEGDREGTGIEYPAAFIPTFSKSRDRTNSDHDDEWEVIESTILVIQEGDVKTPQANLREALRLMSQVETALYENRSLNRTCERVQVASATPFAGVGQDNTLEGAEINLEIRKTAEIHE